MNWDGGNNNGPVCCAPKEACYVSSRIGAALRIPSPVAWGREGSLCSSDMGLPLRI